VAEHPDPRTPKDFTSISGTEYPKALHAPIGTGKQRFSFKLFIQLISTSYIDTIHQDPIHNMTS
jgi:hypothetical protein